MTEISWVKWPYGKVSKYKYDVTAQRKAYSKVEHYPAANRNAAERIAKSLAHEGYFKVAVFEAV
ncbi:MAG: hypothetical protein JRN10_00705 [Nitrososphaerota archaeon]|jgi:hypothetical protein|nr:hypothetical protein [Nitrososphaerota archaeon]MDG6929756.1 hypothetical protein [Nitrososphaerota archaeon]